MIKFILVLVAVSLVGCLPALPKEAEEPQQAQSAAVSIEESAMKACLRKHEGKSKAVIMACAEERSEMMHQQQPATPAPVGIPGTPFTNALFMPPASGAGIPAISDLMGSMPRQMNGHCLIKQDVTVNNKMTDSFIAISPDDQGDFVPCVDGRGRYGAKNMPVDGRDIFSGLAQPTSIRALTLPGSEMQLVVPTSACRGKCTVWFTIEIYSREPLPRLIGSCRKHINIPANADTLTIVVWDGARRDCGFGGVTMPAFE